MGFNIPLFLFLLTWKFYEYGTHVDDAKQKQRFKCHYEFCIVRLVHWAGTLPLPSLKAQKQRLIKKPKPKPSHTHRDSPTTRLRPRVPLSRLQFPIPFSHSSTALRPHSPKRSNFHQICLITSDNWPSQCTSWNSTRARPSLAEICTLYFSGLKTCRRRTALASS